MVKTKDNYTRESDIKLAKMEVDAREIKVGLWSMKEPMPPWEFRKK